MSDLAASSGYRPPPGGDAGRMPQRPITAQLRDDVFRDATALVEHEYAADLTVTSVARRIATSRRHLQRVYAEVGRTSFRTDLCRVRMERAAEMLAAGDLPVCEISDRVGYRQPAQFAKAFRRHHGCAPTEFRDRALAPGPAAAV